MPLQPPDVLERQQAPARDQHRHLPRPLVAAPTLLVYTDCNTGEPNRGVTPGGMAILTGEWPKFDPQDPAQGVTYVHEDGSEMRVPVMGYNGPSRLMFVAPAGWARAPRAQNPQK